MLICEARCGRGAVRRENQDNLILCGRWRDTPDDLLFTASARAAEGLFAVCDGMGGEELPRPLCWPPGRWQGYRRRSLPATVAGSWNRSTAPSAR